MRQSCNSLKCNKKFKLLAPHENTLKTIQRNLHYTAWKWFNGDRFKLIRVNLQKDFRSICGNIQYFAKWRKFQKIQKKIQKMRSVFIAAWPELVQFNCGNFLLCPRLLFSQKTKEDSPLFVCLWRMEQANPSISSEILVMIGSGRFRILNWNERDIFWKLK